MSCRKRKVLTLDQKKKIIEDVNKGELKKKDIASKYGIACSSLSTILQQEKEIMAFEDYFPNQKRRKTAEHPEVDECAKKWLIQCREKLIPIDGYMLKEKAESFARKFGHDEFKASNGWLSNFKKRSGLLNHKLCGESAAVDDGVCDEWREKLLSIIKEYSPRDVFNADETGLFFKCLPDRTFTTNHDDCFDGKRSKERITLLFAANMEGSEKVKPLLIGKSAKPRCFKGVKSFPLEYKANRKAWMTAEFFSGWLKSFDKAMEKQKRKVILFLDNCTAHSPDVSLKCIRIQFLPPNTTSKLQPMDRGIIKNVKHKYRREVVRRYIADIDEGKTTTITILDAMNMIHKAWENVTASTIANCFRGCGFSSTGEEDVNTILPPHDDDNFAIGSEILADNNVNFDDFVSFDDDLPVAGSLTDDDIISSVQPVQEDSDEEGEDHKVAEELVTTKEARAALEKLRKFLGRCDMDNEEESVFAAAVRLENVIDKNSAKFYKQKEITQYCITRQRST